MTKETITRDYLAEVISRSVGVSLLEAKRLLDDVLETVIEGLVETGEVKLSGFGTFKVKQKNKRVGRNPKTGVEAEISERKVVSFYVSQLIKKKINES